MVAGFFSIGTHIFSCIGIVPTSNDSMKYMFNNQQTRFGNQPCKESMIEQKGMTFDHDFGYYFPLFFSLLKKREEENENE